MMYSRPRPTAPSEATLARVSSRSPRIDWVELHRWYQVVLTAGQDWRTKVQRCCGAPWSKGLLTADLETTLEAELTESCKHLRKTLFKTTEKLLRRPMKPLRTPRDCRFLLLLLANPSLHGIRRRRSESRHVTDGESRNTTTVPNGSTGGEQVPTNSGRNAPRCHTGIIKRVLGLMANLPPDNHRHLINWFASYTSADFRKLVDLIGRFVSYRLVLRQRQKSKDHQLQDSTSVLVPQVHGPGAGSPAQLHAALGAKTKSSSPQLLDGRLMYSDDWQIKAAAKVMSLLFQANNNNTHRQYMVSEDHVPSTEGPLSVRQVALDRVGHAANATVNTTNQVSLVGARKRKRLLPTSAFYNTFLDYCNVVADFESWENRQASFSFCQYPMFLSIWAKIRILEYDARRQMEVKARQAFFNSIMSRQAFSQYLILRVRRDCLVEDSLRGVSEVVGSGQEDIKKGLRIAFQGEEGVDAGG